MDKKSYFCDQIITIIKQKVIKYIKLMTYFV